MRHNRKSLDTLLDQRGKSDPGWAYKLAGQQYGMDALAPDDDSMGVDEKRMSAWIPFADGNRRDGVGDLLEVGGIRTERHRMNPICLFDHGKQVALPIGMAEDPETKQYTVEIDPMAKTAKLNCFFYQGKGMAGVNKDDEYDHALFCQQIFDMRAKRLLKSGSIGYQVVKAMNLAPNPETGTPQGLHLLVTLMLEGSLVVLPANMDTVEKMLAMPTICGKPPSPHFIKSLEPYRGEKKAMVTSGYGEKGVGGTYIGLSEWKTEAERRGYIVRQGTSPAGDPGYWTAKDREGNHRGEFDPEKRSGFLKALPGQGEKSWASWLTTIAGALNLAVGNIPFGAALTAAGLAHFLHDKWEADEEAADVAAELKRNHRAELEKLKQELGKGKSIPPAKWKPGLGAEKGFLHKTNIPGLGKVEIETIGTDRVRVESLSDGRIFEGSISGGRVSWSGDNPGPGASAYLSDWLSEHDDKSMSSIKAIRAKYKAAKKPAKPSRPYDKHTIDDLEWYVRGYTRAVETGKGANGQDVYPGTLENFKREIPLMQAEIARRKAAGEKALPLSGTKAIHKGYKAAKGLFQDKIRYAQQTERKARDLSNRAQRSGKESDHLAAVDALEAAYDQWGSVQLMIEFEQGPKDPFYIKEMLRTVKNAQEDCEKLIRLHERDGGKSLPLSCVKGMGTVEVEINGKKYQIATAGFLAAGRLACSAKHGGKPMAWNMTSPLTKTGPMEFTGEFGCDNPPVEASVVFPIPTSGGIGPSKNTARVGPARPAPWANKSLPLSGVKANNPQEEQRIRDRLKKDSDARIAELFSYLTPSDTDDYSNALRKEHQERLKNKKPSEREILARWRGGKALHGVKAIRVRYRNKLIKGYANVEMKFVTSSLPLDKQNEFVKEMHAAGYGRPRQGKYLSEDPPQLAAPLKGMTYNFDVEPGKSLDEDDLTKSLGNASRIARKHGAKYIGSKSLDMGSKGLQKFPIDGRKMGDVKKRAQGLGLKFNWVGSRGTGRMAQEIVSLEGDDDDIQEIRSQYEVKSMNGKSLPSSGTKGVQKTNIPGMGKVKIEVNGSNVRVESLSDGGVFEGSISGGRISWNGDNPGPVASAYLNQWLADNGKGLTTMKTKDLPEEDIADSLPADNDFSDEEALDNDKGMDSEEPFGSQVLRKMHKDHGEQMAEYDGYMKLLDHEHVKNHIQGHLSNLEKSMSGIEKLHSKHYKDLPPIEGAMDDADKDLEEDDAIEAGSGQVELEPAEEAVEGMKRLKSLKGRRVKAHAPRPIKIGQQVETEDGFMGKVVTIKSQGGIDVYVVRSSNGETENVLEGDIKSLSVDGDDKDFDDISTDDATAGMGKALDSREQAVVGEAAKFLKEIGEPSSQFGDDHRMKSYHFHKTLEGIGQEPADAVSAKSMGRRIKAHAPRPIKIGQQVETEDGFMGKVVTIKSQGGIYVYVVRSSNGETENVLEGDIKSLDDDKEEKSDPGSPEWAAEEATEPEHKSLHPHRKACGEASGFFKELANERAFGDAHREKAMTHCKALEEASLGEEEKDFPEEDDADTMALEEDDFETKGDDDFEVGEMGEKGDDDLDKEEKRKNLPTNRIAKVLAVQRKQIDDLKHKLIKLNGVL